MGIDLFKADLDKITYHDIEVFTGILRPEHERRQEGIQIDYKTAISPKDSNHIGETVTAFANTYGGIIMLGVKADKDKQNIPVDIIGIESYMDIKSSITNMIVSTVYPRPSLSIGVAGKPDKSGCVVVIRVEESWITPHIFTKGNANKIAVRVNDNDFPASLQQIEALFERRKFHETLLSERIFDDLFVNDNETGLRIAQHHIIHFIPFNSLNIRLDKDSERSFEQQIKVSFNLSGYDYNIFSRHAKYYEIGIYKKEVVQKKWRLYSNGSMGFISEFGMGSPRKEKLGAVLYDTLCAFKSYQKVLAERQYFGQSYLQHEICITKDTKLLPEMLEPASRMYDPMEGIILGRDTTNSNVYPHEHKIVIILDYSDIQKPEESIAKIFLEHLRMIFDGSVDYNNLLEHIRQLNS